MNVALFTQQCRFPPPQKKKKKKKKKNIYIYIYNNNNNNIKNTIGIWVSIAKELFMKSEKSNQIMKL